MDQVCGVHEGEDCAECVCSDGYGGSGCISEYHTQYICSTQSGNLHDSHITLCNLRMVRFKTNLQVVTRSADGEI